LLGTKGVSRELGWAIFGRGRDLFSNEKHSEAANLFRQAAVVAEQIGDDRLLRLSRKNLDFSNYFIH
jgi:hypothetical protein